MLNNAILLISFLELLLTGLYISGLEFFLCTCPQLILHLVLI
jgi:hypothetical protein